MTIDKFACMKLFQINFFCLVQLVYWIVFGLREANIQYIWLVYLIFYLVGQVKITNFNEPAEHNFIFILHILDNTTYRIPFLFIDFLKSGDSKFSNDSAILV